MNNENKHLIVVDDAESNRYVVATWLRRAGYHVVEARTGAEALQVIDAQPFNLAVLDVNLPDMSGYDICEYIKQNPSLSAMPVLHMSATSINANDRSEGLRRGAEGYLVEPVEREELLATVEALLRAASAHQTSVRLADRLRRLHDATLAIGEVQGTEELAGTIAREATKLLAQPAFVLLTTEGDSFAAVCSGDGECAFYKLDAGAQHHIDALPMTGQVSREEIRELLPAGILSHIPAFAVADVGKRFGQAGRILIARMSGSLDEEQMVVLAQFARVAGAALHNSHMHDVERHIAVTLQRGLLPEIIPLLPGFDVAVRYEASAVHSEVGGDFYDIFEIGDERAFLAVGDVMGHSLEAATIMAQLRTGLRAYALEGHDPIATLEHLNRLLMRFHPSTTATVCCGWLDRKSGECLLVNAGHVPPLLIHEGTPRFLTMDGALLGVSVGTRTTLRVSLSAGDRLIFYTDGLVERKRERIDEGLQRLADIAASQTASMDALCARAFAELRPGNVDDDVAMMAIQRNAG